ncbi:methylmalonyl-CoA epimerase [Virgibacillus sp. W0181]|uniref:methylmalonyl-CoA epimerase n=1 Tax=Virgibacillus sp. W0181 TaxID=3391581 RepID=UPI003F481C37
MNKAKKIAHIGIAVFRIKDALPFYTEQLGLEIEKIELIEIQRVKVAFIKLGESRIELLEPLDDNSTISRFLTKNGEGIHHIALEIDQIEQRICNLKSNGFKLVNHTPVTGANNSKVAFLHPQTTNGVLFELCQSMEKE